MSTSSRREFMKAAAVAAPAIQTALGANDKVNVAVIGFHGRGRSHYNAFARIPGVRIAALCDADERLFPQAVAEIEKIAGYRPDTEFDVRKLLQRKDIDAVSIATPDYWHALMTIWACQAGKDVYVEKPVSFTIVEGRRMVEAARKYNRIVQSGMNMRCEPELRSAVKLMHEGGIGKLYRARVDIVKPRGSIGRVKESSIPQGVHWDLHRGPSPFVPFNLNRFHYGWHFFSDTTTTDVGNSGVHNLDAARWGLNKQVHPIKVHSTGGYYVWDSDQETPNFQTATFEYEDGTILDLTLTNLYSPPAQAWNVYYGSEGYLSTSDNWRAMKGNYTFRGTDVGPTGIWQRTNNVSFPKASYTPIPAPQVEAVDHFTNFINCVRSRKQADLYAEILEGHMSATLCHMANISLRTGRKLTFDPKTERFVGDDEANKFLTRTYRAPYTLPDKV